MPAATGSSSRQPTCRSVPIDTCSAEALEAHHHRQVLGRRARESARAAPSDRRSRGPAARRCCPARRGATGTPAEPGPIRSAYGFSALTPWNTTRKANPVSTHGRTSGITRPPRRHELQRRAAPGPRTPRTHDSGTPRARTAPSASGFSRSVQASSTQKNGSTLPPCASSRCAAVMNGAMTNGDAASAASQTFSRASRPAGARAARR